MEPAEIVRQNQDRFITSHMREKNIMDRAEAVQSLHDSKPHRDFYLSRQDVSNIRKEIDRRDWRFCEDQQRSLLLWAREHKEDVLVLQQQTPIEGTPDHAFVLRSQRTTAAARGEGGYAGECGFYNDSAHSPQTAQSAEAAEDDNADTCSDQPAAEGPPSEAADIDLDRSGQPATAEARADGEACIFNAYNWTPFMLGWMRQSNVEDAIKWGHNRSLQLDATFATNNLKFPLFTLLAVDDHGNGVPIAWLICSQERTEIIQAFLAAVAKRVSWTVLPHSWLQNCACHRDCDDLMSNQAVHQGQSTQ